MDSEQSGPPRRSSRQAVLKRYRVPKAEHYVGYVPDNETPEMIMKKFEELDRVMQEETEDDRRQHPDTTEDDWDGDAAAERVGTSEVTEADSGGMTENQLTKVINATSAFTVRDAFQTDAHVFDEYGTSELDSSDADFELSEEETDNDFWEENNEMTTKSTRHTHSKSKRNSNVHGLQNAAPLGGFFFTKKKSKKCRNGVIQLRIPPPPLPPSWGRTVQPYGIPLTPTHADETDGIGSECVHCTDLTKVDWRPSYSKFMGIMIDPLWISERHLKASIAKLKQLPIVKLCPRGFVFIWIRKTFLQSVWRLLKSWGFAYVENLTWIQLKPNNKICREETTQSRALLPQSHLTLYIFRRGGKDIEIKHQRSSDVVLDIRLPDKGFRVPSEAYKAIETMLPTSMGKLLELWSSSDGNRKGWKHMHESPPPASTIL